MIYPMMLKIDFGSIVSVGRKPKGLLITGVVNWLVKPFSMAFFGWLFFRHLFLPLIGAEGNLGVPGRAVSMGRLLSIDGARLRRRA